MTIKKVNKENETSYSDVISKMDAKQLAVFICMSQDPEGWEGDPDHIKEVYDFLTTPIEKSANEYNDYYSELAEQYLEDINNNK